MSPSLDLHPLCRLFPAMGPEEFARLKESIRSRGYDPRYPIVTYEGQILDGANRWRACEALGITPALDAYDGDDALGFVISANLDRRHLDESQRAMVAAKLATLGHGVKKGDASIEASQPEAARLLNVARAQVQRARVVREQAAPALVRAVEQGRVSVSAAHAVVRLPREEQERIGQEKDARERAKLIKRAKRKAALLPKPSRPTREDLELTAPAVRRGAGSTGPYSIKEWEALTAGEREKIIAAGFESGQAKLNQQSGDSIEWARWSHNTVTGCLHDCPYCYARDIAEKMYPYKFAPTFHPSRLAGPGNTDFPVQLQRDDYAFGNIFANSMSDLFGAWVPRDWIDATLDMARRNPKWRFLTLTKFPQRAVDFEFPDNVWMGTTVDAQARVANAEKAFARISCKTKWLSVEPLLQPVRFEQLALFQWVVIGGASASRKTPAWVPPFDWITDLQRSARDAGCRIYHKTNLMLGDAVRVREFPWTDPKATRLPRSFHYLKGLS